MSGILKLHFLKITEENLWKSTLLIKYHKNVRFQSKNLLFESKQVFLFEMSSRATDLSFKTGFRI